MLYTTENIVMLLVPDLGSRDRDVVLVRRMACWGNPKGGREFGMERDWGGFGEGEISSRATWGQGGQDRTTQREGFQVSERGIKGEQARGAKRWVCAISILPICICVYKIV